MTDLEADIRDWKLVTKSVTRVGLPTGTNVVVEEEGEGEHCKI